MRKEKQTILRRLIALLYHYRPLQLGLILLATFCQVLLTLYLPILIGQAVDLAIQVQQMERLLQLLLHMAGVILVTALFQWLIPLWSNQVIYGAMVILRNQVLEKLHQLPFSYLDRQQAGDLVSRIATDTEQLTNGLLMIFQQFFLGIGTILLTILTMARLDLSMMMVVVVLTPLSLFVARFIAQKSYTYYQQQSQSRGQQAAYLEESLRNLSLIQAFNAQEESLQEFAEWNRRYAQYSEKAIFSSSTTNPVTRFINALIYAMIAGLGAWRIMQGNFTVGGLTTFLNYANQYTKPFNDISSVLSELQNALACAGRLFELLDQPVLTESDCQPLVAEEVVGHIQFQDLSFAYNPETPLIEDFSVDIPAGSKVAIVGPTGAGKSTLINLLMRFYDSDKGQILLDGVPITAYSRQSFREQVGMVLQDTWLKDATIYDNIAYGHPQATRQKVLAAAKAAKADFFIEQLPAGYDTYLADAGEHLSQGQRQLLAIARVFVKLPKVLILDEATSSIDTRTEKLIQEAFETLMEGRTSFIIAHRLSTIETADLILVMVDGKIAEQGNHASLMAQKGLYYRMQTRDISV